MRLTSSLASIVIGASLFGLPAGAEDFPTRAIKIIVPFAPGGPVDVLARAVGEGVRQRTNQSVVVENKPGANTSIGAAACKNAKPDGYTICFLTSSTVTLNPFLYKVLPYDAEKDLEPVTNIVKGRPVLMVSTSVPAKTLAELVELTKREPQKYQYGSFGAGGDSQLVMEWLIKQTGLKLLHVPYPGLAPAQLAFERGDVQLMLPIATPAILERLKSGQARGILTFSDKRDPNIPDVPTFREVGLGELGYQTWFGAFAPSHSPPDRIEKLSKLISEVIHAPDFRSKYVTAGYETVGNTPAEFKKALEEGRLAGKNLVDISGVTIPQ